MDFGKKLESSQKKNLMIDLAQKNLIGGGNEVDSNATAVTSTTTRDSQVNVLGKG